MGHLLFHFILPALGALLFARSEGGAIFSWGRQKTIAFWQMSATIAIDIDHLLADPIYDPERCSIGFHPLHQEWLVVPYLLLVFYKPARWFGWGLLIHFGLDFFDCRF